MTLKRSKDDEIDSVDIYSLATPEILRNSFPGIFTTFSEERKKRKTKEEDFFKNLKTPYLYDIFSAYRYLPTIFIALISRCY